MASLPKTYDEIHKQSLDRRGRPMDGPLPTSMDEVHKIALSRRTR